jgi:hypothetical protein
MRKFIFLSAIFPILFECGFGLKLTVCHPTEGNFVYDGKSRAIRVQKNQKRRKVAYNSGRQKI